MDLGGTRLRPPKGCFNSHKYRWYPATSWSTFLFAVCLYWEFDVPQLELSDRASEAAFGLCTAFTGEPTKMKEEEVREAVEGEADAMDWDEKEVPLPPELAFMWKGV